MQDVHYIEWSALETNKGVSIKYLTPNDEPAAKFLLNDNEEIIKAYAYCNLYGLWAK